MPKPIVKSLPSSVYLSECFSYDPETGELMWRKRPREHFARNRDWMWWNKMRAEKPAGTIASGGYRVITVDARPYQSHRIAWKMMTGDEPPLSIDHINGARADNRWANLRAATDFGQVGNARMNKNNTSGYRGVYLHPQGKWNAVLAHRFLGSFATREEAAAAYDAAARKYFGEFYRKH